MNDRPIVIVGFMGCGKSVVAHELATLLDRPFVDLDAQIEQREGRSPAQIISEDGEQEFRVKETLALRDLVDSAERAVISLGGGGWTTAINRELIRSVHSTVIWLDAPFDICWQRIQQDFSSRPMAPSHSAAEKLFSERKQLYEQADIQIPVTTGSPKQIAENIAALLQHQSHT